MHVTRLNDDALLFVGEAYAANSLILLRGREAVLIDAVGSAEDAERLRKFIAEDLSARVRFIIATHYFSDHMAGLRSFPDADVIAHENYRQTFSSERNRTPEEARHFVEPSITLSGDMTLRWDRYTLDVFYNPGHTMSTMAVDIREADLLHAGDSVVGNIVYFVYSSPDLLQRALERLRRRSRRFTLTSHGDVREGPVFDYALEYLARLEKLTRSATDVLEIPLSQCLAPGLQPTPFEEIFHRRNVEAIAERGLFLHEVLA